MGNSLEGRWEVWGQAGRALPDNTIASVRSKDDNGGDGRFQGSVQVGKALDIQHVDLVDKEHPRNQFCNALVNVFVHHFVDLPSQFI